MIGIMLVKRHIKNYDAMMSKGRFDKASFLAYKHGLGEDRVVVSAKKWYDQLLNERSPDIACAVAIKFGLPDSYLRYAMAEELKLRALDIEEVSYKLMQDAHELRAEAKEIEHSVPMSNDHMKDGFKFEEMTSCELRSRGERLVAQALENGMFFRNRPNGKRFGLEADVFYRIGLAIFENELILGNNKYADLVAKSYKIKESDRKMTIDAVRNRQESNGNNNQS